MNYDDVFEGGKFIKRLPIVEIDLSLSANQRWIPLFEKVDKNQLIKDFRGHVCDIIGFDVYQSNNILVKTIKYIVFAILGLFARYLFYYEDLKAISLLLEIPPEELFLGNIVYEILGGCTSIVCGDADDPFHRPLHLRTLDLPCFPLAKHTVHLIYIRSSNTSSSNSTLTKQILYHDCGWPGTVGCMTAVKPGCFSISLNARYLAPPCTTTYLGYFLSTLITWFLKIVFWIQGTSVANEDLEVYVNQLHSSFERISSILYFTCIPFQRRRRRQYHHYWTCSGLIRYILDHAQSYTEAQELLESMPLLVACYFTLGGCEPSEGCVITRDLHTGYTRSISQLNEQNNECQYIVQTNDDIPLHATYNDLNYQLPTHTAPPTAASTATSSSSSSAAIIPPDLNSLERYQHACVWIDAHSIYAHIVSSNHVGITHPPLLLKRDKEIGSKLRGVIHRKDAGQLLISSFTKNKGVRIQITLYIVVMAPYLTSHDQWKETVNEDHPHENKFPLVGCRVTRAMGGF
jgi:hypothetical protein